MADIVLANSHIYLKEIKYAKNKMFEVLTLQEEKRKEGCKEACILDQRNLGR